MSNLEIFSAAMTAICVFLAGRNSVHTWWTGIIATIAYGVLFFQNQLYADATLQVFFVVTGILGWVWWASNKELAKIQFEAPRNIGLGVLIAVVVAALYAALLHFNTDAYMPGPDSLVLTFSILGQILLMRRKVESWYVWVVVNCISVPLYFSRGLTLSAALYTAFLAHAIYTSYTWYKEGKQNELN